MSKNLKISADKTAETYIPCIEIVPDSNGWQALCPAYEKYCANASGKTKEEACRNIKAVIHMITAKLAKGKNINFGIYV